MVLDVLQHHLLSLCLRCIDQCSSESKVKNSEHVREATMENGEALEADADQSFELFRDSDDLADEYSYDYDDYVDESMWGDEEWTQTQDEKLEDYVNIDSHILCTLYYAGTTSCADVNIGENSYSMVLADNVDGGDDLDLIVTTMNGNVFCFSTPFSSPPP